MGKITFEQAVDMIKDGTHCIHKNCDNVELLRNVLSNARPMKPMRQLDEYPDKFYWSAKGAEIWRGAPMNISGLPTVKLSDIE